MVMYDKSEISLLKRLTPIEDLLAALGFEKINPKTRRAACLLHDGENETSFSWSDDFFNCFACNKSGDKITLVTLVKGYDFKQTINYLSEFTGYKLKSIANFQQRHFINKTKEIPQYAIDVINNQNYELMQTTSIIEKIKEEIEMYNNILCSMRKEKLIISEFYKSIENRLCRLDSMLCYYIFEKHQIIKKTYQKLK